MICFPNAKINIGLNIVEKRDDGYHNIETIFYPVLLSDALEVVTAKKTTLQMSGLPVAGDPQNNLVCKAYALLKNDFQLPEISIFLHKNIPLGGGLGGGSSDGVFMLRLLNDYFSLALTSEQLIHYASQLGSDCAFFVQNKPAYASQRGEEITLIDLDLSAYSIVIIKPNVHISTTEAYRSIVPLKPSMSLTSLIQLPVNEWKYFIVNDFEAVMFSKWPLLKEIKKLLYQQGALYASMTGSGSAIYGIFPLEHFINLPVTNSFVWHHSLSIKMKGCHSG
ncbi:MAG: 4-(cytidine 5'-diphospho)-2-C-methyl-D-erythritol kinase [Microbacter sp.]